MRYSAAMRSFGLLLTGQAATWTTLREADRASVALEHTRRMLDDDEVEAVAARHADDRRARRLAMAAATPDTRPGAPLAH